MGLDTGPGLLDLVVVVAGPDQPGPLAVFDPAGPAFDVGEPLPLKPDAGEEFAEGGAVGTRAGTRRPVQGCEQKAGPVMDDGRELHKEAAPWRALHAQQPGGYSADRDGLVG